MDYLRRIFLGHKFCRPADDEGGDLGGAPTPASPTDTAADTASSSPAIDTTTAAPAVDSGATVGDVSKPTSMLEAMSGALDRQRDELGRFVAKPGEPEVPGATPAVADGKQPEQKPGQAPAAPDDLRAMPDGLTPKAQERFQKLANSNKELEEWKAGAEQQIGYIQSTFQENGISRDQFDTFVQFAGALNRGDLSTAQRIMTQEMQNIALMTGQSLQADPLAAYPDLREAVDGFQTTEAMALEMARRRHAEAATTQRQNAEQQAQRVEQANTQAVTQAQQQIDQFCRHMMTSDLDYIKVEPMLLEAIQGGLLQGVPPQQWGAAVQRQYQLIKKVAASQRTVEPATPVLRPTGVASPRQAPQSMMEAMFNRS